MKRHLPRMFVLVVFLLLLICCRKTVNEATNLKTNESTRVPTVPFPTQTNVQCDFGPDYGDSIVYMQPTNTGTDYFISPINDPGAGQYLSWPQGLSIDSSTGVIDISKSETGQRYVIGFIKAGSVDTCLHSLILGGTSYMDSVYVLSESDTSAAPYFDANPNSPSPCREGSSPGGPGCTFKSRYKILGKELKINDKTGVIDLKKSFVNGIFGPLAFNGQTVTATIDYKLNDGSNLAQQSIDLTFVYYNKTTDISSALLNQISGIRSAIESNNAVVTMNPRPPLIIISRNH